MNQISLRLSARSIGLVRMGRPSTETIVLVITAAIIGYLVLMPLAMLIFGAISDKPPGEADRAFTLANFATVLTRRETYLSLQNTLLYGVGASAIAFLIGTYLAWVCERTNSPLRGLIFAAAITPIFIPSVLVTVSWIWLLSPKSGTINQLLASAFGFSSPPFNVFSLGGMIWISALEEAPLAFLLMWPAFRSMDPALEEAAITSGAGLWQTFTRITLRLAAPAFLAAALLIFVLVIEGISVPLFVGLQAKVIVFSTEVYLATSKLPTDLNLASAYAIVLLLISTVGVMAYRWATATSERYATITGRGFRPHRIDLGRRRFLAFGIAIAIVFITSVLPLFVIVWNSFVPFVRGISFEALQYASLDNYAKLGRLSLAQRAWWNSLYLGLASGVLVMLLTSVAAWLAIRSKARARGLIDILAMTPIAIPGVIVGVSLIWVYLTLPIPIYATPWILLAAYLVRFLPYGMRICYNAFSQVHRELEEAAVASGATWAQGFRLISIPLIVPGLMIGVIYVSMRAFRELPSSIMLTNYGSEVFSTAVYDLWTDGKLGELSAYAALTVAGLILVVALVQQTAKHLGILGSGGD